jgi:NitT/TauT family transport system permease protein
LTENKLADTLRKYLASFVIGIIALVIMIIAISNLLPYPELKSLPLYTFSTVSRIILTLGISTLWGVSFGILAATNKIASILLTPLIDLLQSIPVLGYFPMVIAFLFALGPSGIELSVIILLFTSMAWSIFFGVVGAIRGIPANVTESARSFGLTGWRRIRHVILPAITPAVISGANLAWCDGWFFIIAAEYIQYQGSVVSPPSGGLGFLLAQASYQYKDMTLAAVLLLFITFIVVYFNTLTWHKLMERTSAGTLKPVFKVDLSGIGKLGITRANAWSHFGKLHWPKSYSIAAQRLKKHSRLETGIAALIVMALFIFFLYPVLGRFPTVSIIQKGFTEPPASQLGALPLLILFTMGRLTLAYGISLIVAIGMGVLAAEHKKFAKIFAPLFDIGQGVPILALFPVISLGLNNLIGNPEFALEITCIIILVLDMIWYMFLNIESAVKNIPTDVTEVGKIFGFKGLKRVTHIVIPSILPAIVTGSILSWGTGWNTIIFAEYLPSTSTSTAPISVPGIGSLLDQAGYEYGNTVVLILILAIIASIVLLMEGFVWRRLLRKFEKYHIEV